MCSNQNVRQPSWFTLWLTHWHASVFQCDACWLPQPQSKEEALNLSLTRKHVVNRIRDRADFCMI